MKAMTVFVPSQFEFIELKYILLMQPSIISKRKTSYSLKKKEYSNLSRKTYRRLNTNLLYIENNTYCKLT